MFFNFSIFQSFNLSIFQSFNLSIFLRISTGCKAFTLQKCLICSLHEIPGASTTPLAFLTAGNSTSSPIILDVS